MTHDPARSPPDSTGLEPDRFLAEELRLGDDNPNRAADSIVVHAMLSLLAPGDAERTQQRVKAAMATIRAQARERERWQLGRWVRRASAAAVLAAASLAIAIMVFQVEETSASDTLSRLMDKASGLSNRTYSVAIRHNGPEYGNEARALLVLGDNDRFVFSFSDPMPGGPGNRGQRGQPGSSNQPGPPNRLLSNVGFDGLEYWAELPGQRCIRSADPGPLRLLLSSLSDGDGDGAAVLTLESAMDRLGRGYDLSLTRLTDPRTGMSLVNVVATRRPNATDQSGVRRPRDGGGGDSQGGRDARAKPEDHRGPGSMRNGGQHRRGMDFMDAEAPAVVRIVADASTFEVVSLTSDWLAPNGELRRQVELNRAGTHAYSDDWFTPEGRGLQTVDPSQWSGNRQGGGRPQRPPQRPSESGT